MMKNIYTIAGTLLLLGAVLSCTREKALEPEQDAPMRFAVTVEGDTKASMTSADLGQFYLKVTGPNNAFSFFDTIVKEGETWKASSKRLLWKDEESSITYAAASYGALGADYFNIPVTNDLFTSGATMGLLTDQGTQEKLNAADLLTMKETTLAFADTDDGIVPVTLKHGLAKANFKFTLAPEYFDNGVGLEASPITGLALSGVHTSFFFSPLTGEVSIPDGASKGAVIPFQSSYEPGTEAAKPALAVAEAILVPEAFAAGALTLYFTVAGKDFTWTNSEALTFEQGGEYEIPVSVAYVAAPVTPDPGDPVLDGALCGKFSVSDTKKVYFSKGNLQAKIASYSSNVATASEWKFADSQYSCIGNAAGNNSFAADSWVDLFCWVGASADKNTYGLITFTSSSQANHGNVSDESLKTDWGTAAASSIGSGWRTLSSAEWEYLFGTNSSNKRTTTSGLYFAKATVNSVLGVILLPDDWSTSYYTLSSANSKNAAFTVNQISSSDWSSKLESHGCVFLPAAGRRIGSLVDVVGWGGVYWSSSAFDAGNAYCVDFYSGGVYPAIGGVRYDGFSVRLVHDVAAADPATDPAVADLSLLSAATTADIGKVVCADGHLHDAKTAVPTGCTAVGILGKVTETGHGLILALHDATAQNWDTINGWTSVTTYAGTTLKVLPDDAALGTNLTSYTKLGETTVSNWAVAQKDDYEAIFINLGSTTDDNNGTTYDANVNAYITTGVDGDAISGVYWSATEFDDTRAWFFYNDYWGDGFKISGSVRPVLGFGGEAAPVTPDPGDTVLDGALSGKFSVSDTKQVNFSKGNLRYAAGTWSFFDNQYDYYTSYSADAWDKFGWSTSATTYGMDTSTDNDTYSGDFVDWGATMGTGWFTLSSAEWTYLFNTRTVNGGTGSGKSYTVGQKVNDVFGVVLYPDDYTGSTYTTGSDWSTFESAGCVFLPAAGYRLGSSVSNVGSYGRYWSSTANGTDEAYSVLSFSGYVDPADYFNRFLGFSVRLVREVE